MEGRGVAEVSLGAPCRMQLPHGQLIVMCGHAGVCGRAPPKKGFWKQAPARARVPAEVPWAA
jgi:hypothetical protein